MNPKLPWLHGNPPTRSAAAPARPLWLSPAAALLCLIGVLLATAGIAYMMAHRWVADGIERELSSVARMKSEQIEAWLEERQMDAQLVVAAPEFMRRMRQWLDGSRDPALAAELMAHLERQSAAAHFDRFCLRSGADGAPIPGSHCVADSPALRDKAVAAALGNAPQLGELARDEANAALNVGMFIPVALADGQAPRVVAHVSVDPGTTLFPRLQRWLGSSPSAEALLVRRQGDNVLFLNTLRYRDDPPLTLLRPLTDEALLAAQAVQGHVGMVRGVDYRGVPSVGYVTTVAGTPWLVVAKMDQAEADAWLDRLGLFVIVALALALLAGFWWWMERQRHVASLNKHELARALLSHRLISVQEDERRRLSAELHDRTSPNLATLDINLRSLAKCLPAGMNDEAAMLLDDATALLADTADSIRDVCADLRPPILDYAGLLPALQSYAHQFSARTGIAVELDCPGEPMRFPPDLESTLFRIAQEALTNCAKHAAAARVCIGFELSDGDICMEITDDGIGFATCAMGEGFGAAGLGLLSMRERAEFAGGSLSVDSRPGDGTHLRVCIPVASTPLRVPESRRQTIFHQA